MKTKFIFLLININLLYMQSPYYKIKIKDGKDITDLCSGLTYEDCIEEDDLLKFNLTFNKAEELDDDSFEQGKEIEFIYGYIGGKRSSLRTAKISDIDPSFGTSISCSIAAIDEGQSMKKDSSQKIWKGKTASQIATEIAKNYNLTPVVDNTTKVYDSFPQAGKNDFELLKQLASMQENGSFIFYIKGTKLVFQKRNLNSNSKKTFTWNYGNGTVLSFKPSIKKTKKDGSESETKIVAIDPLSKKVNTVKSNSDTVKDETSLGKFTGPNKNADSKEVTGKLIPSKSTNIEDMKNESSKIKKDASLSNLTASLVIEGDPDIDAGDIITMKGVGVKFSGNWYVVKAVHDVKSSYKSTLELSKDATDKPVTKESKETKDKNLTTGPDKTNSSVTIKRQSN